MVAAKGLLLLFLFMGVTVLVVSYVRKSKTVESRPDPNGYMAHFNHPTLTPPEWVNWDEGDSDGGTTRKSDPADA